MSDLTIRAVTCEACDGEGRKCLDCSTDGSLGKCEIVPCPDCVNGLVPSPEAIEAAGEANWYEWHKGHPGGFKGAMRDMGRAAIIAAAHTPQGDDDD